MIRRTPLRCRLFGHKPTGHRYANHDMLGHPRTDGLFSIASRCARCHADTTLTVPARYTIVCRDEPTA